MLSYKNYISDLQNSKPRTYKIDGHREILTMLELEDSHLSLFTVQNYNESYKNLIVSKYLVVLFIILYILLAVVLVIPLSKFIYQPLTDFFKQLKEKYNGIADDDIIANTDFLVDIFSKKLLQLESYEQQEYLSQYIIAENYVKFKIYGINNEASQDEINSNSIINTIEKDIFSHCVMCVIMIENIDKILDNKIFTYRTLTSSIKETICDELNLSHLDFLFCCRSNEILLIINKTEDDIYQTLKKIILDVKMHFDIVLSCFISDTIYSIDNLSEAYNNIQNMKDYRLIYGENSILSNKIISESINRETAFPQKTASEILAQLKDGNDPNIIISLFNDFCTEIKFSSITLYRTMLLQLLLSVNSAVKALNFKATVELENKFTQLSKTVMSTQSKAELDDSFKDFVCAVIEQKNQNTQMHVPLVDAVKKYIYSNYHLYDLSLNTIALKYHISPSYLSKIYKDETGYSIPAFITDIRMKKAVYLLENTDTPVKDIAVSVGFSNESTFFKLFKKQFNITPKQYKTLHSIQK